jgi:hypothetical protein
MTFLEPAMLAALPLVALPLVIHLVNQRRLRPLPWAAMMFLLSARAVSPGYSRLRHWLVMGLRMLAVAAVLLAAGRPLARGFSAVLGGGRPDTAIVILDRSPSMLARGVADAETKLDAGRRSLAESLAALEAGRCLLVADPARPPLEAASPRDLVDLPAAGPAAAPADVPALLQAAYDHVRENAAGATEIWICSDQRSNDWAPESGAWSGIREAFAKLPQPVRFQLVSLPGLPAGNVAVRVTAARVEPRGDGRELVLSVAVARPEDGERIVVPVSFEIAGASSSVEVELAGREATLVNHAIPLGQSAAARGFGRVSIPPDACAADDEFWFVFAEPVERRTIIVAEDPACGRRLALVAEIPPAKELSSRVELLAAADLPTAALEETALVIWQGRLPQGEPAELLEAHARRGGQILFLPPAEPDAARFAGLGWDAWTTHDRPLAPVSWRTDGDLLANTAAGAALPVGGLEIRRSCRIAGDPVALVSLPEGLPLVGRAAGTGVCFLGTTPADRDSSLAAEGVVLYALVQRAIDRGVESLGRARQLDAGPAAAATLAAAPADWRSVAGPAVTFPAEPGLHAGVFAAADRLVAVNRPVVEDAGRPVPDDRIDALFRDLAYSRLNEPAGGSGGAVREIWRAFLVATILALVGEGLLCLPPPPAARPSARTAARPLETAA